MSVAMVESAGLRRQYKKGALLSPRKQASATPAGRGGHNCTRWAAMLAAIQEIAMHILDENTVAISGFASIRERVLLLVRCFFCHVLPDDIFDGCGSCLSFAYAWCSSCGSTGLHYHHGVDIVSLIPRGQLLHQGTIGAGALVYAGN